MADVPLGMFLSGGIDSSGGGRADGARGRPPDRDVLGGVRRSARSASWNTRARSRGRSAPRSHEIVIDDHDFFGALPRLVWHEDEPIAHPSSVPLHFVSALARAARQGRADRRRQRRTARRLRQVSARRCSTGSAGGVYERMVPGRGARGGRGGGRPAAAGSARPLRAPIVPGDAARRRRRCSSTTSPACRCTLQRELLDRVDAGGADAVRAVARILRRRANGDSSVLGRLLYTDIKTYLVELLMKQDQMSMSTSIESRVPFLDHVLVEFAARLPERLKLRGLTTKRILREAMRGLLPRVDPDAPEDGLPGAVRRLDARPLERRRARRAARPPHARARPDRTRRRSSALLDEHRAGRRDGGDAIWALMNLELWYRTFIDGDGIQTLPAPSSTPATLPAAGRATGVSIAPERPPRCASSG